MPGPISVLSGVRQQPVVHTSPWKNQMCIPFFPFPSPSTPTNGKATKLYQPLSGVSQTLWSSCKLPGTFFFWVAHGPQTCRVYQILSPLLKRYDRNQSLRQSPRSWNTGHILQLFLSPGRSQELGFFSYVFCTELGGMTVISEYVLVQTTTFVLRGPDLTPIPIQHLVSGKIETSPLDSSLKCLNARGVS